MIKDPGKVRHSCRSHTQPTLPQPTTPLEILYLTNEPAYGLASPASAWWWEHPTPGLDFLKRRVFFSFILYDFVLWRRQSFLPPPYHRGAQCWEKDLSPCHAKNLLFSRCWLLVYHTKWYKWWIKISCTWKIIHGTFQRESVALSVLDWPVCPQEHSCHSLPHLEVQGSVTCKENQTIPNNGAVVNFRSASWTK